MTTDTLCSRVLSYFEDELDFTRKRLDAGLFDKFRDRIVASRKIADALEMLAPYCRKDQRARKLVRRGESLRKELLSVREVICKKHGARSKGHTALLVRILCRKKQLQ
jgi:hypothetical protein